MWVYNVAREIYQYDGRMVELEDTPQNDEEIFQQAANFSFISEEANKVWVLEVHQILRADLPRSKVISTHREPRDVLVSFLAFMKSSFDNSISCAREVQRYTEIYKDSDPEYLMLLAYNDIENRPVELILEIAAFLDVTLTEDKATKIADKFTRKNVKQIIDKSHDALEEKLANQQTADRKEMVYFSDSNYRAFDKKTVFQTGHVSQRNTGDWMNVLSESEQRQLNEEFGDWLNQYGYID